MNCIGLFSLVDGKGSQHLGCLGMLRDDIHIKHALLFFFNSACQFVFIDHNKHKWQDFSTA